MGTTGDDGDESSVVTTVAEGEDVLIWLTASVVDECRGLRAALVELLGWLSQGIRWGDSCGDNGSTAFQFGCVEESL